ncbi:MAG: 4Fe-4S binding protein, partial [Pseudomonadota bacterium]
QRARPSLERPARYLKFVLLAVLLSLFMITGDSEWFIYSPLQHFFRVGVEWRLLAPGIVALIAAVFYFRFWCRFLCPAGAFLALFNRVRLLRRWAPNTVPARCDLGVSSEHDIDCIRCGRCTFVDGKRVGRTGADGNEAV